MNRNDGGYCVLVDHLLLVAQTPQTRRLGPRDFIPHGRSESARAQGFTCGKALVRPVGRRRYCASDGKPGSFNGTG